MSESSTRQRSVVANACTNCRKKRMRCDGKKPCFRCNDNEQPESCLYVGSAKVARNTMQRQIDELEQSIKSATEIFQSLALRQQVPSILQSLRDGDDWDAIAHAINSESTSDSPDVMETEDNDSPSFGGDQVDLISTEGNKCSTAVPRHADVPSSKSLRRRDMACDTCKFRHQKCDGRKPACDTCQQRDLRCKYTDTPASKVQPSDILHPSSTAIAQGEEELKCPSSLSGYSNDDTGDQLRLAVSEVQLAIIQNLFLPSEKSRHLQSVLDDIYPLALPTLRPLDTIPREIILRKALIDGIEAVLRSDFRKMLPLCTPEDDFHASEEDIDMIRGKGIHHIEALNPFHHYTAVTVLPLLNTFLQRLNSVFYLFEENELEHHFEEVSDSASSSPDSVLAQLCLALALGAQVSNGGNDDQMIMWYENGRRYLDVENWHNELWVMRALVLVSMYHIEERRETSRHYLGIALDIGRAHLLNDGSCVGCSGQPEHMKWHRLWSSVRFLQNWLSLSSDSDSIGENDQYPNIDPQQCKPPPSPYLTEHSIQYTMTRLLHNHRNVVREMSYVHTMAIDTYEESIDEISACITNAPDWFEYRDFAELSSMNDHQRVISLYLQSMRLGSVIVLTRPLLLQAIDADIGQPSRKGALEFGVAKLAHVCMSSASDLTQLCLMILQLGSFPEKFWLPLHFLFEAAMVSILGIVYHKQQYDVTQSVFSKSQLEKATSALDASIRVLAYCAVTNRMARQYWTIVTHFQRHLKR